VKGGSRRRSVQYATGRGNTHFTEHPVRRRQSDADAPVYGWSPGSRVDTTFRPSRGKRPQWHDLKRARRIQSRGRLWILAPDWVTGTKFPYMPHMLLHDHGAPYVTTIVARALSRQACLRRARVFDRHNKQKRRGVARWISCQYRRGFVPNAQNLVCNCACEDKCSIRAVDSRHADGVC
jgi:hypothetical protein